MLTQSAKTLVFRNEIHFFTVGQSEKRPAQIRPVGINQKLDSLSPLVDSPASAPELTPSIFVPFVTSWFYLRPACLSARLPAFI